MKGASQVAHWPRIHQQCRIHRRWGFYPWVVKLPWRRKWQPPAVLLPGKSHGQRSLTGNSPWDLKRVGHDLTTKQQEKGKDIIVLISSSPWETAASPGFLVHDVKSTNCENPLVVQGFGRCAFTEEGLAGFDPWLGTKIPQAMQHSQKKKTNSNF